MADAVRVARRDGRYEDSIPVPSLFLVDIVCTRTPPATNSDMARLSAISVRINASTAMPARDATRVPPRGSAPRVHHHGVDKYGCADGRVRRAWIPKPGVPPMKASSRSFHTCRSARVRPAIRRVYPPSQPESTQARRCQHVMRRVSPPVAAQRASTAVESANTGAPTAPPPGARSQTGRPSYQRLPAVVPHELPSPRRAIPRPSTACSPWRPMNPFHTRVDGP